MQWSADDNAGFSANDTWLPVHPDYATSNVQVRCTNLMSLCVMHVSYFHVVYVHVIAT